MRIGVDATSWSNRRGYGRFARNAIGRLVELDGARDYCLVAADDERALLPARASRLPVRLRGAATGGGGRPLRDLARLTRAVRGARLDLFLFPSLYTWFPVPGTPSIVGVHDVLSREVSEPLFPSRRARLAWGAKEALAIRSAARIFTVSAASRVALAARFGLDPREVAVVPEAPDPVFGPRRPAEISAALRDLAIDPGAGYFLYAAGISPHKDLRTLLAGYAVLRARRPQAPPLVVVGDVDQTEYVPAGARVRSMIAELGIADRVLLPGFVSDEVLACLYGAATAVVNPSPAEGFGLPAVEAAACGAACVLSDIPAHRETLGGAALFVPPRAPEALGAALEQMLEDEAGRRELGGRARAAVAPLSWEAAARVLRDEITAVVEG